MDEDIKLIQEHGGIEGIANKLNTHLENGLEDVNFIQREKLFGQNKLTKQKEKSDNRSYIVLFMCGIYILIAVVSFVFLIVSSALITDNVASNVLN